MPVIHITKNDYEAIVLKSEKPVLLDFFATWCGPCRMVAPILEEIAEECPRYTIVKIDVDEEPSLANDFGVTSIPTLVVMKNGKPTAQAVGYRDKAAILAMLEG